MSRPLIWAMVVGLLVALLILACLLSLSVGPAGISLPRAIRLWRAGAGGTYESIILDIRLPRVLLGFAVGGGLSLAGVILQGLFRNPLVEPYTLGVSGGAVLGVSVGGILGLSRLAGPYVLPLAGFAGALAAIFFLRALSAKKGILSVQALLLVGIMVNFICSSLVLLIMSFSRLEDIHSILFWMMGSLGETDWLLVKVAVIATIAALVLSYFFCFDLNALSIGEEEALHLGIHVERTKRMLFVLTSLVTGLCVSLAGVIGFVGLVVPHLLRLLVGPDHRILLVSSFLAGAVFLILSDTIARMVVLPLELPVGVVTGIVGGVLFIYALSKKTHAGGL
ncbi:MAG TPA: iron ABC transporter permease [Syntrophorhabdaceae bacterium]|nr:iron ABC transporter permease [Syntrophorhabdaceae bacterium]